MKIRQAVLSDLSQINKLNKKYFKEIRDFKTLLESRNDILIVLENAKEIIAFSGIHLNKWNNTARVIDIFVHPDHRRQGLASKLIIELIALAKKKKVRSLIAEAPSLNPVLKLYKKNGFRKCGYNDRYYSNSAKEIAIFLSFDLK
ncbi:MAG: GNAT family N-acetyltransferase [Patescibacteria group bacterium]